MMNKSTLHVGYIVLVRSKTGEWIVDWDSIVHFDKESAALEAAEAQREGWHVMLAELRTSPTDEPTTSEGEKERC